MEKAEDSEMFFSKKKNMEQCRILFHLLKDKSGVHCVN